MTTGQGSVPLEITRMLASGSLELVAPSRDRSVRLLVQARHHLTSADQLADTDPEGAYALLYDAARKALTAVLEHHGLRTTSKPGHHRAAHDALACMVPGAAGSALIPFDRMRRVRAAAEYPRNDMPGIEPRDVRADHAKASRIVDVCSEAIGEAPLP